MRRSVRGSFDPHAGRERKARLDGFSALYENVTFATITTLRRLTSRLLDRAAGGGSVVVRRNDRPVAVLIGYDAFERLLEIEGRLDHLETLIHARRIAAADPDVTLDDLVIALDSFDEPLLEAEDEHPSCLSHLKMS